MSKDSAFQDLVLGALVSSDKEALLRDSIDDLDRRVFGASFVTALSTLRKDLQVGRDIDGTLPHAAFLVYRHAGSLLVHKGKGIPSAEKMNQKDDSIKLLLSYFDLTSGKMPLSEFADCIADLEEKVFIRDFAADPQGALQFLQESIPDYFAPLLAEIVDVQVLTVFRWFAKNAINRRDAKAIACVAEVFYHLTVTRGMSQEKAYKWFSTYAQKLITAASLGNHDNPMPIEVERRLQRDTGRRIITESSFRRAR